MPEEPKKIANKVLQDYIVTRNDNPNMSTDVLKSKFPEINQFAALNQVKPEKVIGELDSYYNNYRSGKFNTIDELNNATPFFFGEATTVSDLESPATQQLDSSAPTDSGLTNKVLQDYIVTRNDNPDMDEETLKGKFPEIDAYSQSTHQNSGDVISQLDSYYNDYRSGEFSTIEDLNAKYGFGGELKKKDVPQGSVVGDGTSELEPGVSEQQNVDPLLVTKQTIEGNLDKPFIKRMVSPTIKRQNDDGSVSSHLLEYAEAGGEYIVYPTIIDKDGVAFEPEDPYQDAISNNNFVVFDNEQDAADFAGGSWKEAVSEEQGRINSQKASMGLPQGKQDVPFEFVPPEEDKQDFSQFEGTETLGTFEDETFEERKETSKQVKKDFKKKVEVVQNDMDNLYEQTLELDENDKLNRLPGEQALVNDIVFGSSEVLPQGLTPENAPRLFGDDEKLLPGAQDLYENSQRRASQNYLLGLSKDSRDKFFEDISSGLSEEEANSEFRNKMDEIGVNYLSESDLKIKKLQDEIAELEITPFGERDTQFNIDLKNKKSELKSINNTKELYDPETGEYISGNEKIEGEAENRIKTFGTLSDKYQIKYQDTDVADLRKIRDELFFKYKSFTEDFMIENWDTAFTPGMSIKYVDSNGKTVGRPTTGGGEKDVKAIVTYEDTEDPDKTKTYEVDLSTQRARAKFVGGKSTGSGLLVDGATNEWNQKLKSKRDNLLAEYMAVNRVLALNIDPGSVEEAGFFQSLGQGITEGLGGTPMSEDVLADKAIKNIKADGVSLTSEQKDRLEKDFFTQKVPRTIGNSVPVSLEIGYNIMLGNKALGVAKLGKLAKTLAKGDKMSEIFLNMGAESITQGLAFSRSGESTLSGVGEGIGQSFASALLSKFGVKNKILNFGARLIAGATAETAAEFSGQFIDEMANNGFDLEKAAEVTFGKTIDEQIEKVALTYITALAMGIGGAGQDSKAFLQDSYSEIQKSDSNSEIVKYAKQFDVTSDFTETDNARLENLKSKSDSEQGLSEEEFVEAEMLETRKKVNELDGRGVKSEAAPIMSDTEGDTEYKFKEGEEEGFVSEEEIIEKLDDEEFVQKVKDSGVELEINNPSDAVREKVNEKFPLTAEEKAVEADISGEQDVEAEIDAEPTESLVKPNVGTGGDRDFQSFTGEEVEVKITGLDEKGNPNTSGRSKTVEVQVAKKNEKGKFQIEQTETFDTIEEAEAFANEQASQDSSIKAETAPEVEAEVKQIQETDGKEEVTTEETVTEETFVEAETKSLLEESAEEVVDQVDNVREGVAPFSQKKVFDATIDLAKKIAEATGKKGKALIQEVKSRLEEKIEGFDTADIDAMSSEITEAVKDVEVKVEEKTAEVKPKKIKTTGKKVADIIREAKLNPPKMDDLRMDLRQPFAKVWNTAIETTALAAQGTANVAQAVSDGVKILKESDFYKNLTDKNKKEAEKRVRNSLKAYAQAVKDKKNTDEKKQEKQQKKKSEAQKQEAKEKRERSKAEKYRTSNVAERRSKLEGDPKEKQRILDEGKYKVTSDEEVYGIIDELFAKVGYQGALDFARNNKEKLSPALYTAIVGDAGSKLKIEGKKLGDYDMIEEGERAYEEYKKRQNEAGLQIQKAQELYNRNPTLYWNQRLDTNNDASKYEVLSSDYSEDQTVEEAIDDTQNEIVEELTKKNSELEQEVEKLTGELFEATEKQKKQAKINSSIQKQKQVGQQKVTEGTDKLKKFFKKGGATANAGLDPLLIEAIGDIITGYIQQGIADARKIVNKTYNIVRNSGGNLTKKNIQNIADSLNEFNSIKRQEQVSTFYEKIKGMMGSQREVSASTIDEMVDNPNSVWEQYQKNIVSEVNAYVNKLKDSSKLSTEEKAELDKLSKEMVKEVNAKIKQISANNKRRTKGDRKAKDVLADLMANSDKLMEVYMNIYNSPGVSFETQQAIQAILDQEVVYSNTLVGNLINQELVNDQRSINDIVRTHYSGKEKMVSDLAEKLVAQAGLDVTEAKFVAGFIKDKMSSIIEEKTKKALEKFLIKGIKSADIRKAIKSGNITPEVQKEINKRVKSRESRKLIQRVINAVNMGALQSPEFTDAFSEKFGFNNLDMRTKAKFNSLVEEVERLRSPENTTKTINGRDYDITQRERIMAIEKELNTIIDTISPKNLAYLAENWINYKYLAVLSGVSTQMNANIGATMTLAPNVLVYGLRNISSARGVLMGIVNGAKAFKAASSRAALARKKGFVEVGVTQGSFEKGFSSDKSPGRFSGFRSGIERQMMTGFDKALQNLEGKKYGKAAINGITTLLLQPLRAFHLLSASDAFLSTSVSAFVETVETYNAQAKTLGMSPLQTFTGIGKVKGGNLSNMTFMERVQLALNNDAESKAAFESISENEYNNIELEQREKLVKEGYTGSKLEKKLNREMRKVVGGVRFGENPKKAYKNRRKQELKENADFERFKYTTSMVKDWLMIGTPDGIAGATTKGVSSFFTIDKEKDNVFKIIAKTIGASVFMFPRLMANSWNHIKTGVPLIGMIDAWAGMGVDPVTGEFSYKDKSAREQIRDFFVGGKFKADRNRAYQRMMLNSLSTTAAVAIFQNMFRWDDDEEDWVLREDRDIDIIGPGGTSYTKNIQSAEDFTKFSFSITKDENGNFTNYTSTRLSPYAQGITAFLSTFADDAKGLTSDDKRRDRKGDFVSKATKGVFANPFQVWWEGSFNSIGRLVRTGQKEESAAEGIVAAGQQIALDNTKALLQPSFYKDIVKTVTKQTGGQVKKADTFQEKFLRGFYGLDFMLEDKTDMFGNTYPVTDNIDKWITGVEKMSERHDDASLLYKFDGGLNIAKWRADTFSKYGQTSLIPGAPKFESTTDENQDRITARQEEIFKKMVNDSFNDLDAIENKADLEHAMDWIQDESKKAAKNELIPKFIEEGTMVVVTK